MTDSSIPGALQMARPRETRQLLGQWIRLTRQRIGLTQPLLASKSGVSVTTVSRLEREGQGGVDNLLRVLQALGELDGFHAHVQELLRKASLPSDLSELKQPARPRLRVRLRRSPEGSA
jgi:transcriptional regulator with XRE-family HTH domain